MHMLSLTRERPMAVHRNTITTYTPTNTLVVYMFLFLTSPSMLGLILAMLMGRKYFMLLR